MAADWIPLAICAAGLCAYAAVLAVFQVRIARAKKQAGTDVPRASGSFTAVLIAAPVLIVLAWLVPFQLPVRGVLTACGVLGAYIVLQDRREAVQKKSPTP